jgi:hypothetical protein
MAMTDKITVPEEIVRSGQSEMPASDPTESFFKRITKSVRLMGRGTKRPPDPTTEILTLVAFAILTAVTFALIWELPRYRYLVGWGSTKLGFLDECILVWLLSAKSLIYLIPCLLITVAAVYTKAIRVSRAFFALCWLSLFYWMTLDIFLMSVTGSHVSDYFPYAKDIVLSVNEDYLQWAGDRVLLRAWAVLQILVFLGLGLFYLVRKTIDRLTRKSSPSSSGRRAGFAVAFAFLFVVGALVAQVLITSPVMVSGIYAVLPFGRDLCETANRITEEVINASLAHARPASESSILLASVDSQDVSTGISKPLIIENVATADLDLSDCRLLNTEGTQVTLRGEVPTLKAGRLNWPGEFGIGTRWFVLEPNGNLRYQLRSSIDRGVTHLTFCDAGKFQDGQQFNLDKEIASLLSGYLKDCASPQPPDTTAVVRAENKPNVVVLVLESLNYLECSEKLLTRLYSWGSKGLICDRHYSASNTTHLAIWSILSGKSPLAYESLMDRKEPPQLNESLRRSGYSCVYVAGGAHKGWMRMDTFLNKDTFDRMFVHVDGLDRGELEENQIITPTTVLPRTPLDKINFTRRCETDKMALEDAATILNSNSSKPTFVLGYLVASRYPYSFFPQFARFQPSENSLILFNEPTLLVNRYRNGVLSMEDAVMNFIERLDPEKNLIIVTADHGESLREDGTISHGSRPSEIQCRVPFFMVGPGIQPERISTATSHIDVVPTVLHALAGKPVKAEGCTGKDLLNPDERVDEVNTAPLCGQIRLLLIRDKKKFVFDVTCRLPQAPVVTFQGLFREDGLPVLDPAIRTKVDRERVMSTPW